MNDKGRNRWQRHVGVCEGMQHQAGHRPARDTHRNECEGQKPYESFHSLAVVERSGVKGVRALRSSIIQLLQLGVLCSPGLLADKLAHRLLPRLFPCRGVTGLSGH